MVGQRSALRVAMLSFGCGAGAWLSTHNDEPLPATAPAAIDRTVGTPSAVSEPPVTPTVHEQATDSEEPRAVPPSDAGPAPDEQSPGAPSEPARAPEAGENQPNRSAEIPRLVLIEGESVHPEQVFAFTRTVLIEEGDAVAQMSHYAKNINTVRHDMNNYMVGHAAASTAIGGHHILHGPLKGWRATSTSGISTWPSSSYPASRQESMRRAKLLEPLPVAGPSADLDQLWLYYLPILVGHDGQQYMAEDAVLAFFVHPANGRRATVLHHKGQTYVALGTPLTATSWIYVRDVASYAAGPLGLARARVPKIFYSKGVRVDAPVVPVGDRLEMTMRQIFEDRSAGAIEPAAVHQLAAELAHSLDDPVHTSETAALQTAR